MAKLILAGVVGSLLGMLPLALVNLLVNGSGSFGDIEAAAVQNATLLGAAALLGGPALGGSVAGWMAGRRGGLRAAAVAGTIAAALYAVSVILLVVGGAKAGWGPPIAALHPIRASAAIVLVAGLLLGVALLVGWLVGRSAAPAARLAPGAQGGAFAPPAGGPPQRQPAPERDPRLAAGSRAPAAGRSTPRSQR